MTNKPINDMTAEFVRSQFSYNPKTGQFRWKVRRAQRTKIGGIAGTTTLSGYYAVSIYPRRYYVHRLAFLIMTGRWPKQEIDHINGNKLDNRWCNLREATRSENSANKRKQKNNHSGYKGVSKRKDGLYIAQIVISGQHIWLGSWETKNEAAAAYITANRVLNKDFANH